MRSPWIITKTWIKESNWGNQEPVNIQSTNYDKENLSTKSFRFRLYDDDHNLYFEGTFYGDSPDFEPLYDYGKAFGCTIMKYLESNGIWEEV